MTYVYQLKLALSFYIDDMLCNERQDVIYTIRVSHDLTIACKNN